MCHWIGISAKRLQKLTRHDEWMNVKLADKLEEISTGWKHLP